MTTFASKVRTLRWDDHRFYHQSRINQSLHFVSGISFVVAYALLPVDPALAGLIGWLVGMVTRQSGHLFFEPRGYDAIHETTYEHKEAIKVGYNMRRKAILVSLWLALPVLLYLARVFGLASDASSFAHQLGLLWLGLGASGVVFRTVHLFSLRGPSWGLAWAYKILTDPFHNIINYWSSPIALLRGQLLDPLEDEERAHA